MKAIFNKLYKASFKSFKNLILKDLTTENKRFIVTVNPETIITATKDEKFKSLLLYKNTTIVADGISVVKAGRMLGYEIKERIAGIDIANELLKAGNQLKHSLYLFGATEEVINLLRMKIKTLYPNINIVGTYNGYDYNKDDVFKDIVKRQPDIVLVALGIPSQEKLIYKYLHKFNKGIFVGVGGSFDVLSGYKKRAPKIFIKLNLEWLYRLVCEPQRIKRFYNNNIKFIFKILKIKIKS
jgi:N-acetylglucosaminyldiphosphoundecaprenol N-acetyl-beta-D-mannosaminyltransferase